MNFERCAQRKRKENTMTERQQSNNWLLLPTSLLRVLYIKMYFNGGRISRWRNVDVQNIHAYIISPSICTTQKKKFLCQSTAFYGSELFSQRQINKRSYTWDLYQMDYRLHFSCAILSSLMYIRKKGCSNIQNMQKHAEKTAECWHHYFKEWKKKKKN